MNLSCNEKLQVFNKNLEQSSIYSNKNNLLCLDEYVCKIKNKISIDI